MEAKSFQETVFDAVKSLTGQSNILTIPREFVHYTGDVESALFLSQLIYWCDKGKNKEGWIYKTYQDWKEDICLTEYAVRKARKKLEKMGILETKIKKANGNPTVHYRLKSNEFLEQFLNSFLRNQRNETAKSKKRNCEIKESLTKTTTKTTTRNIYSIFDFWNSKKIIVHRDLNTDIEKAISKALRDTSPEEIKTAIERYAIIYHDKSYYFKHPWGLAAFLKQKNGYKTFLDDGEKWVAYQNQQQQPSSPEPEVACKVPLFRE